jgi:hypothetical protein
MRTAAIAGLAALALAAACGGDDGPSAAEKRAAMDRWVRAADDACEKAEEAGELERAAEAAGLRVCGRWATATTRLASEAGKGAYEPAEFVRRMARRLTRLQREAVRAWRTLTAALASKGRSRGAPVEPGDVS